MLTVAGSEVRAAPGEPLSAIMGAPAYLGGSLTAIAGVIFLRQGKVKTGGLILLLLIPGFFYVTYQNFGNDPQWLLLLAVLLLALRDQSDDDCQDKGNEWDSREPAGNKVDHAYKNEDEDRIDHHRDRVRGKKFPYKLVLPDPVGELSGRIRFDR